MKRYRIILKGQIFFGRGQLTTLLMCFNPYVYVNVYGYVYVNANVVFVYRSARECV